MQKVVTTSQTVFIRVLTFPYYRLFDFNTLGPINHVAKLTRQPDTFPALLRFLRRWRERKLAELQFISIAVRINSCLFPDRTTA